VLYILFNRLTKKILHPVESVNGLLSIHDNFPLCSWAIFHRF